MRKNIHTSFYIVFISLISLVLAACGSSGGGGSGSQVNTQQGVFLDALVQGVSYTSGSTSGTTDANGNFSYEPGKTVTFKIGDIVLGTVTAAPIITPISLTGASSATDRRVVNMVRFLLTLDDDGNWGNGIQITSAVRAAAAGQRVEFNVTPLAFKNNNDVVTALSVMVKGARPLVSESDAQTHFNNTIIAMRQNLAGNYSGTFSGGNSGSWNITVDASGNITGSGNSNTTGSFPVSGQIDGNGRGAFGNGGSASFTGFFAMNGCFAGSWVDYGVSPGTSGTFSGSKSGSSASNCSAISSIMPNINTGNTGGGAATNISGQLSITGSDTSQLGSSFSPKLAGGSFSSEVTLMDNTVSPTAIRIMKITFSGNTVTGITFSVPISYRVYAYSLDCASGVPNICGGISIFGSAIRFTNQVMTPDPAIGSANGAKADITLNGEISVTL